MELNELRRQFVAYFEARGYQTHPAAPLIPENDQTVLFTTAGMQQFKDCYQHPNQAPAPKVVTVQPVVRTSDIAEVGDDVHLTAFEMLGNFRFGELSSMSLKQEAISEAWELITEKLGVAKDRVQATVFAGDEVITADTEAEGIWRSLGISVQQAGRDDNFWGPTGQEGPCGPTTEIYIDGVEVWNLVFNQYYQDRDGKFSKLEKVGLDTGAGLERLATTLQGKTSVWEIEPFKSWVESVSAQDSAAGRVIIDHLKAIIFLINSGVTPGNKAQNYTLRRLIRKTVFVARNQEVDWQKAIETIRQAYDIYVIRSVSEISKIFYEEKQAFEKSLVRCASYLERWIDSNKSTNEKDITRLAFYMFESFGFPKELVIEHLVSQGLAVDPKYFEELFAQHQEVSRVGAHQQFKGGLADHEPQTVKHHTASHLLLAALRQVLGNQIVQKGSNVTSERLRLDFNYDRKLTEQELRKVEDTVNEQIMADIQVTHVTMPKEQALNSGALAEFGHKYGDTVTVYSIGDFSKELCGGPHVERTGQLGRFEILKEEASSQGVRRIKARCRPT